MVFEKKPKIGIVVGLKSEKEHFHPNTIYSLKVGMGRKHIMQQRELLTKMLT